MHEVSQLALDGLLDAVTLLFTQSRLGETISLMQRTVQDIRGRVTQLFHDYVAVCNPDEFKSLEEDLNKRLLNARAACIQQMDLALRDHVDYCLREILVCFELARQICAQHSSVETRQHLFADLPILRPFDYPGFTTRPPLDQPQP